MILNLSIILPVYNSAKTLEKCLKAVRASDRRGFELIVVDDGSTDSSTEIASRYADKVIKHENNKGRVEARRAGMRAASGDILVNIDSDVVIKPDTLSVIAGYFEKHEEVDALTGKLTKECPYADFFSQYKNLYMHYIFSKLPERVSFLYGSIFAVRRTPAGLYASQVSIADDTEFGQELYKAGHRIAFLKELEVTHYKRFDFLSWVKNNFKIPYDWARIFIRKQAWKQLGKEKTGFAHSPKEQLASVMLAPSIVFLALINPLLNLPGAIFVILLLIWFLLNLKFFLFLTKERGSIFGLIKAIPVTFLDHIVMATGIVCGFLSYAKRRLFKEKS